MRALLPLLALLIGAVFPLRLTAQTATPSGVVARPGELVRLRTAQWEYTGTLVRVAGDTALLHFGADSALVPRARVVRTEVQRGTRRSTTRVILMSLAGGAVGSVAGMALGVALECGASCDGPDYEGLAGAVLGFVGGTTTGLIAGGIYGGKKRYPRWVGASLP